MAVEIIQKRVTGSSSPIGFSQCEEGWWSYLTIHGERLFNIGNCCPTCQCLFRRLPGNTQSNVEVGQRLAYKLNAGVSHPTTETLSQIEMLVPDGDYAVIFMKAKPTLCHPGDANDYFSNEHMDEWEVIVDHPIENPQTPYYRLRTGYQEESTWRDVVHKSFWLECAIPLSDPNTLDRDRVEHYRHLLTRQTEPTVLACGLYDYRESGDRIPFDVGGEIIGGNILLHYYILDGHHKIQAAAELGQDLNFLVYLRAENLDQRKLEFLKVIHHQPLPRHEKLLSHLNDRSVPAPARRRKLAQLIPYLKYRRVFNAFVRIASNDEEPVELIEAAAEALNSRWRCREYIAKHEMDLLPGLTSTAKEIVGKVETAWEW